VNKNSKRFITLSLHECGFAHLFLLVVIVVIGIVGLLYYSWQKGMMKTAPTLDLFPTPTPDTYISGNWKAYENDYWGFKLKYPIDSFVACGNISEKEGLRLWKTPFECPEGHDILSSISVIGYKPGDFNPKHTIILPQKIQVAGVENNLYKYEYYESDGPLYVLKESTVFVISLNDRTLEIAYHGINEKDKETFFNILDTVELYDSQISQNLQKPEDYDYYQGEISPRVPYTGLKFREINIHDFRPLLAQLDETDYHEGEFVIDGYTFIAREGEDFEFIAREDRQSNPGSFIGTELYGWGPTVIRMDTTIGWGVPATTRYFYVVKGNDRYGPNFVVPDGSGRSYDGSKYGKYTLIITQRK